MKKRIYLMVISRGKEKECEFLSRQENGAYIAVDCNVVDPRLSLIHPILLAPRDAEERTNYLVILLTENFLHRPAVLRYCSTNAYLAPSFVVYCASQLDRNVCIGVVNICIGTRKERFC